MASIIQIHDGVAIKRFPINKPSIKIGRKPDNDIFIDDKVVSTTHAEIEMLENPDKAGTKAYFIKDLGSTNNTYVNGKKIAHRRLNNNDLIRIGLNDFKFVEEEEEISEKTVRIRKSWIPGVYYTEE